MQLKLFLALGVNWASDWILHHLMQHIISSKGVPSLSGEEMPLSGSTAFQFIRLSLTVLFNFCIFLPALGN